MFTKNNACIYFAGFALQSVAHHTGTPLKGCGAVLLGWIKLSEAWKERGKTCVGERAQFVMPQPVAAWK